MKYASELRYLRYFYRVVEPALGPAYGDTIASIQERFQEETGKKVPRGYSYLEPESEEDTCGICGALITDDCTCECEGWRTPEEIYFCVKCECPQSKLKPCEHGIPQ